MRNKAKKKERIILSRELISIQADGHIRCSDRTVTELIDRLEQRPRIPLRPMNESGCCCGSEYMSRLRPDVKVA